MWKRTVNIKDLLSDDGSPEEVVRIASIIADRLEAAFPEDDELQWILEEFREITVDDNRPCVLFNDTLNSLYDWADYERVWLGL